VTVCDIRGSERRFDAAEVELRIGTGAGDSAHIGEHLHVCGLQQGDEFIDAAGGMADCVKHLSPFRWPRPSRSRDRFAALIIPNRCGATRRMRAPLAIS
jgi:hypothetical protein